MNNLYKLLTLREEQPQARQEASRMNFKRGIKLVRRFKMETFGKIKKMLRGAYVIPLIITIFILLSVLQSNVHAAVLFSENFSSGTFGSITPLFIPGDPCDATGDVSVDQTDHRPGSADNFAYHIKPPAGDIAACARGPAVFSVGQGKEIYFTFWQKYGSNNLWESGAGKGPEIRGSYEDRIVVGPAWFDEAWSIPNPPICSGGSRCATTPVIMNFVAFWANGGSWRQYNSCDGLSWTQNINTSNPVYIERGYWYKHKLYVYAHATNGRMRLWVQREDWPQEREIIDTNLQGCGTLKTLIGASSIFSEASPHYNYDDHGGGGANTGFEIWLDDMVVEDADAPNVVINGYGDTYTTTNPTISLSGTANDPGGTNIGITNVRYSNDRGGSGNCSGTTSWSCNNISLQSGQNIITVTATDGDGKTGIDVLVVNPSGGGDTQAPTVPAGLLAQAVSSSQINLSWTASTDNTGVSGYRIYRCTGSSCTPSIQIATSTTNSYQNTGLTVNTTYVYRVAAYDAAGNISIQSSSANAATQATADTTPPAAPTGLMIQ